MTTTAASPTRNSVVLLREITKENLRPVLRLRVASKQERFVASNAVSIAEAYFDREVAWFRAVYADETPVGFLMLADQPERQRYFLWRFMIDQRFQRMGFGARALDLLVEHVRTRPDATAVLTSCVPEPGGPGPFYEKNGFVYTGELDEGERVMRRALWRALPAREGG